MKRDDAIPYVPAHAKPTISERHVYWIVGAVLVGIVLLQWRALV